jgi:hypothetical protein
MALAPARSGATRTTRARTRHPESIRACGNWHEGATCDPLAIAEFWWKHKGSIVGIATGAGSGAFVLDVDPKNDEYESIGAS